MTSSVRRLAAEVVAIASVLVAAVAFAAPGVGRAECDPNFSHNESGMCKPPPPPPPWYTPPPPYAPMYAPQWIPPPPPPPPWATSLHPVWDQWHQQWVWVGI